MARTAPSSAEIEVRGLERKDLDEVIRIDALHTGERKPDYWKGVFRDFVDGGGERPRVGLAAILDGRLVGYVLGEVRAFEFNSEACGWVFGAGVDPGSLRQGVASMLLAESCRRFRALGVTRVRTMVLRNDVPVLSFFRTNGFVAGSFVQLELDLEEEP